MTKVLTIEEALRKRASPVTIESLLRGASGLDGAKGRDGTSGSDGLDGKDGPAGTQGATGKDGKSFAWRSTFSLQTEYQPEDVVNYQGAVFICLAKSKGVRPDLRKKLWELVVSPSSGSGGSGGTSSPPVAYTAVSDIEYYINGDDLIVGHNIFGVDTTENATIHLPASSDPIKIVVIKNEMNGYTVTILPA